MKISVIPGNGKATAFAAVVAVSLFIAAKVAAQAIAAVASQAPEQMATGAIAEVERVIVTGSNIPTAEETGPEPGGHVSASRHREVGHSQCNRPHHFSAAAGRR